MQNDIVRGSAISFPKLEEETEYEQLVISTTWGNSWHCPSIDGNTLGCVSWCTISHISGTLCGHLDLQTWHWMISFSGATWRIMCSLIVSMILQTPKTRPIRRPETSQWTSCSRSWTAPPADRRWAFMWQKGHLIYAIFNKYDKLSNPNICHKNPSHSLLTCVSHKLMINMCNREWSPLYKAIFTLWCTGLWCATLVWPYSQTRSTSGDKYGTASEWKEKLKPLGLVYTIIINSTLDFTNMIRHNSRKETKLSLAVLLWIFMWICTNI